MTSVATYWQIQYELDPFKQESRNVGVILNWDGKSLARMLPSKEAVGPFPHFTLRLGLDSALEVVYSEWCYWFLRLAAECSTPPAIQSALDRLDRTGSRFKSGVPTRLRPAPDQEPGELLDALFIEVTSTLVNEPVEREGAMTEWVVKSLELPGDYELEIDIELEILDPRKPVFVHLPILVTKPSVVAIKALRRSDHGTRAGLAAINDIIFTFDALVSHSIVENRKCAVIYDGTPIEGSVILDGLSGRYRALDMRSYDDRRELRQLIMS